MRSARGKWRAVAFALGAVGVIGAGNVAAVAGATSGNVGYDPGMVRRCILATPRAERWSYTPDCAGGSTDAGNWHVWGTGNRKIGFLDATTTTPPRNPNSRLQTTWERPAPGLGIGGWLVGTQIRRGLVVGENEPAHEANLSISNWFRGPIRGLRSQHTFYMASRSGQSNAEYGIFFTNPADGENFVLNLVLPPYNPNTNVDAKVIYHARTGCKPQYSWCNNVIKLKGDKWLGRQPPIANTTLGYTSFVIDWEALLDYVHSRGWWPKVTADMVVDREWFQIQAWPSSSDSLEVGAIRTYQGNWRMYYP